MESPRPNPFTATTNVRFSTPRDGHAVVRILDLRGRVVRALLDASVAAGNQEISWDGRDGSGRHLASGVYWARVETDETSVAKKITLLR